MKFSPWEEGYICGAVTYEEGKRLARLAGKVAADQVIVELGSHGGSSTSWLALGSHKGRGAHVWAIDPWTAEAGERLDQHAHPAVRRRFDAQIDFMASAGYIDATKVHPVEGYSTEVAAGWDLPVGLLHVDALHTYEAVIADLAAWVPHLAPRAVVVLHDTDHPSFGARRAGLELALREGWEMIGDHPGTRRRHRHGQMILRAP